MTRRGDWGPLGDLADVQKRLNQMFERALAPSNFGTQPVPHAWTPIADAYETGEGLTLVLELPGADADRIELRVDGDQLVVEGEKPDESRDGERHHRMERSHGRFSRRFKLPPDADPDAIQARYRLGELRVLVPFRRPTSRGTIHVPIRGGDA